MTKKWTRKKERHVEKKRRVESLASEPKRLGLAPTSSSHSDKPRTGGDIARHPQVVWILSLSIFQNSLRKQ